MKTTIISLFCAFILPVTQAAVLAEYNFSTDLSPTTTGTGVTADDFSTVANAGYSGGNENLFLRTDVTGSTESDALSDADYFEFTVSAATPGEVLDLESLVFDFGGSDSLSNGPYDTTIYVQSSVDGLGSGNPTVGSFTHTVPVGSTGTAGLTSGTTLDLTGFANQTSITFQFSFADTVDDSSRVNRFDNVQLNGAVVIPEPSTLVLTGAALFAFCVYRRRRG